MDVKFRASHFFVIEKSRLGDAWNVLQLPAKFDFTTGVLPPTGEWFETLAQAEFRRDELIRQVENSAQGG